MRKVDATQGGLIKLIFIYTIPLILTTIAQHLFTIVDTAVLGNMADTAAVASVGATTTITNLVLNGITGLATGVSIVLSRYVGQKSEEKIRATIDTALISCLGFGALVASVGLIFSPLFLTLIECPPDCYDGATLYLRIILAAAPATLMYNFGAAILRALGDTQRPMYYIAISGIVNVVLNVILCLILPQKVAAVAIATVASKVISAALVLNRLFHWEDSARVSLKKLRFYPEAFLNIVRYGIPTSISSLLYPVANLQIAPAINSFGVDAVAGGSASNHIHSIAASFTNGFAHATTTFMGQNIGAQHPERVKKSFWYCLLLGSLITGSVGMLIYLSGEFWLGLVLGRDATEAIAYGMIRMEYLTRFIFVSTILNVLVHALQAYGYPIFGSISSICFTLGFRVFWMQLVYPHYKTYACLMLCFITSWALNALFNAVFVVIIGRRYSKGKYRKI